MEMSTRPEEHESADSAATGESTSHVPAEKKKAESVWEVTHTAGAPPQAEEWNQTVENSADACLYHRAEIAPLFLEPTAHEMIFVQCRLDGKLVGGAILVVTKYRWHRFFTRKNIRASLGPVSVPPFVVDGLPPKIAEAAFDRLVDASVVIADEWKSDFLVFGDAPISRRTMIERPILNRYYTSTDWQSLVGYDYVIDLRRDSDTLFKNLASSQRGHIRKARGVIRVVAGTDLPDGREFFANLMEMMYRREKFCLLAREQLCRVFESVYDGDRGQTFFGLADGKPVCVAGISRSGQIASYLHAARTDDAMNGAQSLSLWTGIEWTKAAGCEWFELGGIIPERNRERLRAIREFKKSFGGEIIQVHGGRREFRPLAQATYEFIDGCGAAAKGWLKRLNPFHRSTQHEAHP
jgi:hypothetical protein